MNNDVRSVYCDLLQLKRVLVVYQGVGPGRTSLYDADCLFWQWIESVYWPHHRIYERYGNFKEGS
jgi:hypothetical protein